MVLWPNCLYKVESNAIHGSDEKTDTFSEICTEDMTNMESDEASSEFQPQIHANSRKHTLDSFEKFFRVLC